MRPGWYPNPDDNPNNPQAERWWNGTQWTAHTRPTQTGQPPRISSQTAVAILTILAVTALTAWTLLGR